jgi:hypothetical protein
MKMDLFKGLEGMADMVKAAPGLMQAASEMQANAQAQVQAGQQAAAAPVAAAEPQPGNLEPIAGVTLEQYTAVVKGAGANAANADALTQLASAQGITAANWATAKEGWGARIQSDRGLGTKFNALYTA